MANYSNIPIGLRVPTQIPLDAKGNIASEAALKDLGLNNNLAFTYEKGLIVYCKLEGTHYKWEEVLPGQELTGLLTSDFIYPDGVVTNDVIYSNKKYNFFPINTTSTSNLTYINQGDNITITGTGTQLNPFVINGLMSPLNQINEGNGNGIIIRDRVSANYGNVGLNAVDLSYSSGISSTRGATGGNSFAANIANTSSGVASATFGRDNLSSGDSSFSAGRNNIASAIASISLGNNNQSLQDNTITLGNTTIASGLYAITSGTGVYARSWGEISLGTYNTDYTPIGVIGHSLTDRVFNVGNGSNSFVRSDALTILKNGLATLPSVTDTLIENATGKAIVTREYLESKIPPIPDGSETKLVAGTNITIVGNGTTLTPYNISYNATTISQYTDEMARDAVGTILQNTSTLTFDYDDVLESITADVNINASSTSTGILQGGVLSIGSLTTLWTIQAGEGYIYNSLLNTTKKITWVTQSDLVATYLTTNIATYVLIDDLGGIVQQTTSPTQSQLRTHIYIGKLAHTTLTSILFTVTEPSRMFDIAGQIGDLNAAIGPINVGGGNVINHNGSNLTISTTAGGTYRPGSNYSANRNSPSITSEPQVLAPTFRRKYRNGTGGWIAVNSTTIDPDRYDNNSGTLVTVPTGKFTVQVLWRFGGTGTIHVDYGQAYYDTLEQARASIGGSVVVQDPDNVRDAVKRGWLVVKQNTNVLNNTTDAVFIQADKFGERGATGAIPSLQTTYNNSTTPEIETNSSLGAFSIKRGSASDSDNVFEIINGLGAITSSIKGDGSLTAVSYNGYIPENNINKAINFTTVNDTLYPTVQAVKTQLDLKINSSEKAAANGVATLGADSKIPNSQLPALAITDTFPVASQAAMLALSTAEQGDVAVRTDISKSFILTQSPASTLANWQELLTPTDAVQSVNGQTGSVTLTTSNITEGSNLYYTEARVSANTNVATNTAFRHSAVTVSEPNNGLTLGGQTLTLGLASTSTTGALSSTDWNTFNNKAPLASPTFTGTPSLPTGTIAVTQSAGDSSTKVATTAFVMAADAGNVKLIGSQTITGVKTYLDTNLNIINNSTPGTRGVLIYQNSSDIVGAQINWLKSRGSNSSPTNVSSGDIIGAFNSKAYMSGAYTNDRSLFGSCVTSATGISQFFITGTTDVNYTPRILIYENGNVGIGSIGGTVITTLTPPNAKLQIIDTTNSVGGSNANSVLNLSQTWNTTGTPTAIKLNVTDTTSNANSLLLDLQTDGSSKFSLVKSGVATFASTVTASNGQLIGGTGTSGSIVKWTGAGTQGNSIMSESGNTITLQGTGDTAFNVQTNTSGSPVVNLVAAGSDAGSIKYDRATSQLRLSNSSSNNILNLTAAGNVLIGTTTDDGVNKLQVNGAVRTAGRIIINPSDVTGAETNILYQVNGTSVGIIGSDGALFGGSSSNFGMFVYGANDLELSTNAVKRVIVKGNGNTLIGTTTDDGVNKLQVNGGAKIASLAGTGTRMVTADASGNLSTGTTIYKVYVALMSQTGTDAPVATVLDNTLGGTLVWTRNSSGSYTGTLAGVFTTNKTVILFNASSSSFSTFIKLNTTNGTIDWQNGADDRMTNPGTMIEIRVYP